MLVKKFQKLFSNLHTPHLLVAVVVAVVDGEALVEEVVDPEVVVEEDVVDGNTSYAKHCHLLKFTVIYK
jgi:hypothetical protein